MNLLKHMEIHAEIAMERACLSVEYTFVNTSDNACLPRYIFPIPHEGEISGLQLLSKERQLIRAKMAPLRDETLTGGVRLTKVSPTLYCLETGELNMGEECRILLELFCPLAPCKDGARLAIPLGVVGTGDGSPCTVDLSLYLDSKVVATSHPVKEEENCVKVQTISGKDFVITVAGKKESSCLIQEQWGESVGVYRLYTKSPSIYRRLKKKKVLLLLDTAWAGAERNFGAVKELCYRAAQVLPKGTMVQVMAGSMEGTLMPESMPAGEELCQQLFGMLQTLPYGAGVQSLLERAKVWTDADTLTVLFSQGAMPCLMGKEYPCIHLVTTGNVVTSPLGHDWGWGEHLHCYPDEIPYDKMNEAMVRWTNPTVEVTVVPQGGAQDIIVFPQRDIGADGYLELALKTTGQAPVAFTLSQDGEVKETIAVQSMTCMEHLPMAVQGYGRAKRMQLERLLTRTDVGSHCVIKAQIESVSLTYGILSTETVLALGEMGETSMSAVEFCLSADTGFGRQTVFGEAVRNYGNKQELIQACIAVLMEHIRPDGGIYQFVAERAEQTAWAVLALSAIKEKDRAIAAVIKDAEDYLSACHITGTAEFLYHNRKNDCKEIWQTHLPNLDALLGQERTVTVAAQLLLHLS